MKTLKIPQDVELKDTLNRPVLAEDGKPVCLNLKTFLLLRMQDPKFAEGKTGLDAAEFALETKHMIESQSFIAGEKLMLEDEQWRRLKAASLEPTSPYDPRIIHCLVPLLKAIVDATHVKE